MDRAQIHTLEAFIGALLIVGALLFASQATAVTPLSASTSNQHIENQQQTMAEDLLTVTASDRSLQDALTFWNTSVEHTPAHFAHTDPNQSTYSSLVDTQFNHPLEGSLSSAFQDGVYAYNLELRFLDTDGTFETTDMIRMGTPSDNAVTATQTVILFEDDRIANGDEEGSQLGELPEDEFWAPDVDGSSSVYNVVEVRFTLWRM